MRLSIAASTLLLVAAPVFGLLPATAPAPLPSPPAQPADGPGGAAHAHGRVVASFHGEGGTAYWVFEPADPVPTAAAAVPVIVFNHGWGAIHPGPYAEWIDHLVHRGNVVIYPLYQANLTVAPADFTPNATVAIKAALGWLGEQAGGGGHARPDLGRVAFVGHSMGGILSANLAAQAAAAGLPAAKAVMCVEPGKTWARPVLAAVTLADLSTVPAETLLLAVTGDQDTVVRDVDAKRIYYETTKVPAANKNFVRLLSDAHGRPALRADHFAPIAANGRYAATAPATAPAPTVAKTFGVDALDYYGTWKLCDALLDAAFYGTNRKYALGNTPEQRFMGRWSDGVAVKELEVLDKP